MMHAVIPNKPGTCHLGAQQRCDNGQNMDRSTKGIAPRDRCRNWLPHYASGDAFPYPVARSLTPAVHLTDMHRNLIIAYKVFATGR